MGIVRGVPLLALLVCVFFAGSGSAQSPVGPPGPVLSQRFQLASQAAVPDSAGDPVAAAVLGSIGGVVGFFPGVFVPVVGIVLGPALGAGYGARIADRATGGTNPSVAWSNWGAAIGLVGAAVLMLPLCATEFCQGAPIWAALIVGPGVGAAAGIALERKRRMSEPVPADSTPVPAAPSPRSRP